MHKTVLLEEVTSHLNVEPGKIFIDATLGNGGHTEDIFKKKCSPVRVIGFDHDEEAILRAKRRLARYQNRVTFINKSFINIPSVLQEEGVEGVDGIIFDLGVSTEQLLNKERGFSFMNAGPLDMRMDRSIKETAYNLIHSLTEYELTSHIRLYGEEKWAKKIARNIVLTREKNEIKTTDELAAIVSASIPKRFHPSKIHPATKTFQAIRIAVNDELSVLKKGLQNGVQSLKKGGRFCVISFHSLEDRIVKKFFREAARDCICDPDIPVCICDTQKMLAVITKRPIVPLDDEVKSNPRARSAKLRVAEKV